MQSRRRPSPSLRVYLAVALACAPAPGACSSPDAQAVDGDGDASTDVADATPDVPVQPPDGTSDAATDAEPDTVAPDLIAADAPVSDTVASCLACASRTLDFGVTELGRVTGQGASCTATCRVTVTAAAITPSHEALSFTIGTPASFDAQPPIALEPNERIDLAVHYEPRQEERLPSGTALVITTSEGVTQAFPIMGSAREGRACAQPVIAIEGGLGFALGATVKLSGRDTLIGAGGGITVWSWSLSSRPQGSTAGFLPSNDLVDVTLVPDIAGHYVVQLDVRDHGGVDGCSYARASFGAGGFPLPLRVELAWHTAPGLIHPGPPPDPGIHLAHPNASGYDLWGDAALEPWYDLRWDAFWGTFMYGKADWGLAGLLTDDPRLQADMDTGPSGLENVTLDRPEALIYRIGVDRYRAPNEAMTPLPVQARVAVYLGQSLAGISPYRAIVTDDFWEVGTVDPTSGTFTLIDELHPGVDTCPMPQCGD